MLEASCSKWLKQVRLTRKTSGKLCFTLDFRKLNDTVPLDEFLLPNMNEILCNLYYKEIFIIIDLKDGYFQVPLLPSDRDKTTFLTPDNRHLRFTRMPQGYKNAPATFQRGMTMILEGLIGSSC